MAVISMSTKEIERLHTLLDVAEDRIGVTDAAVLMGVSRRHVSRLMRKFMADGAAGLASRKRGRRSNRSLSDVYRSTVLGIVRDRYPDFGPTLAAEKLQEVHQLPISRETLRQWMIADGLWLRRHDRRRRSSRLRPASERPKRLPRKGAAPKDGPVPRCRSLQPR
jgi:hypothetical protein